MGQTDWFMDDAGSRENSGADAAHPIPELERQFRMGGDPRWTANEYHLHYLTDPTVPCRWVGRLDTTSTLFIHGSATHGAGQSTAYSGTIDSIVALNRPANQPIEITSNALPTSWTASGLVNKRIRLTSGAASGAKGWAMVDLGTKKARCSEFNVGGAYTGPFAIPAAAANPAATNTFVVENLTTIGRAHIGLDGVYSPVTTSQYNVVFDSLNLGGTGFTGMFYGASRANIVLDGCTFNMGANTNGTFASLYFTSCAFSNSGGPRSLRMEVYGGYGYGTIRINFDATMVGVIRRFIGQGTGVMFCTSPGGDIHGWNAMELGFFDCGFGGPTLKGTQTLFLETGSIIWGSGNVTTPTLVFRVGSGVIYRDSGASSGNPVLTVAANFPIINSAGDILLPPGSYSRTSTPVYDADVGLWTQPRTLTFANLVAEVQNGGFSPNGHPGQPMFIDPLSGCSMGMNF